MADYSDTDRCSNDSAQDLCVNRLDAGYHQAALDEASRVYTAFRTIHGLYEWTRVPMNVWLRSLVGRPD